MVTAARFRVLALSFEGALEVPHMERAAFRTTRRIFATLPPDGASANLLLDPELQEAVCAELPEAFAPVPGGWGRMGYTTVTLGAISERDLLRVLGLAHARANEPKTKKKPGKTSPKRRARTPR
jgi:hypothetical protein